MAAAPDGPEVVSAVLDAPPDEPEVVPFRRSLTRAGLVVAAAMAAGNALNYVYQIIMSRLLGSSSFGALGALLAVSFIVTVPGLALQMVVARHTALRDRDAVEVGDLWAAVLRAVVLVGLCLMAAGAAASPALVKFLHLGSVTPALWLAFSLLPLPALPAILGMLQGRERFRELSATLLAGAIAKLSLGALFVAMGFGVSGALAGAGIGSLLGALLGVSWIRTDVLRAGTGGRIGAALRRELGSTWFAIFSLFLVVNLDIVLARHFLPRAVSGLYAVGAVVAKVAYWAPRFVIVVVFPRMAKEEDRRRLLARSVLVVVAFSAIVVAIVAASSNLLLGGVFGDQYRGLGSTLWLFAGIGTAFALVHLLLFSGIAVGDRRLGTALAVAVAAKATVVTLFFHSSVTQVAAVVLVTAVALLVVAVVLELTRGAVTPPRERAEAGAVGAHAG